MVTSPAPTVIGPSLVGVPPHYVQGRRSRVPRWACLVLADAVAVAGSTALVGLLDGGVLRERLPLNPPLFVVMVTSFVTALGVSGAYGRLASGLIASQP